MLLIILGKVMNKLLCRKCGEYKHQCEFNKDSNRGSGYAYYCKECKKEYDREYRKRNRKKRNAQIREWHGRNKESQTLKRKEYYRENKKYISDKQKNYYVENRDLILRKHLQYYNKRRKSDLNFRILGNLRCRLYKAVKHNQKSKPTLDLIGCDINVLRSHLESQFAEGMTWDNYGEWHVDHIKPCASFDLSNEEEQKICFNYKNLQPLWAEDNMRKGSK
jgi:hypothetical protein